MIRTPLSSRWFALAAISLLVACAGSVDPGQGHGTLIVRADVSASAVATLVAEVTALDIPTSLVFNIPIVAGVASGTITVPAGSNRTVTLRAYDAGGILTHSGSATLNIQSRTNATVAITPTPLTGDPASVVTLGACTLAGAPSSPTVAIRGTVQLAVAITDWHWAPTTRT